PNRQSAPPPSCTAADLYRQNLPLAPDGMHDRVGPLRLTRKSSAHRQKRYYREKSGLNVAGGLGAGGAAGGAPAGIGGATMPIAVRLALRGLRLRLEPAVLVALLCLGARRIVALGRRLLALRLDRLLVDRGAHRCEHVRV